MKKSEVAELLLLMCAYDNREVTEVQVEAWYLLDVCQRYDLATCKAAVVKFWTQPADDRGQSRYLDPSQLASMVRLVRRDQRREVDRVRARVRGVVYQAYIEAGGTEEEANWARANMTNTADLMVESGAAPGEVLAWLLDTEAAAKRPAIESGEVAE